MISIVAIHTFRNLLRDGRVLAGACLLLVLGLVALFSAGARYQTLSAERSLAQAEVAHQWAEQGEKNPHSAAHYGQYAFRPALALEFFDPGVSNFEGVSIWLEAHKQNFALGRPADDMTALARFGELSLAFIFQALVPLALILLAYPAIAAERESGTLRQVLASGVSANKFFMGKLLGLSGAAVCLLLPLLFMCFAVLLWGAGLNVLPAALGLLGLYMWFGLIILVLSLLISARASSPQVALLVLLGIWAMTTFVVPRVAADFARVVAMTPSAHNFYNGVENDLATGLEGDAPAVQIEKRRVALLKLYKVNSEVDFPINFQGIIFGLQDELSHAVYDKHLGFIEKAIDKQLDLFEGVSILAPRMAVMLISQELSGTSIAHQRYFTQDAERFRRQLMEVLNKDITLHSRAGQSNYRAGVDLWQRAGAYEFKPEPLSAALSRCGAPFMVLLLWSFSLCIAGWAICRHLKVLA